MTSSTAVLVVRSSLPCTNERGMVLLGATCTGLGPQYVGKASRRARGVGTGRNEVSGGDGEAEDEIDICK